MTAQATKLQRRPQTAASRAAVPQQEKSLSKLAQDLAAECETWSARFDKAASWPVDQLLVVTAGGQDSSGNGQPAMGTQARRQQELLEALKLVAERLGAASMQVQHTRGQASTLDQVHGKLVASERERDRQVQLADEARASESRALAELSVLRTDLAREEAARRDTSDADAKIARAVTEQKLRSELADLKSEVASLRRTAEQEMCERFSSTREPEAAKRQIDNLRSIVQQQPRPRSHGGELRRDRSECQPAR